MNRFSAMLGLLALALLAPARAELPQYVMRDLGMFGGESAAANSVNSGGMIAGSYGTGAGSRAFLWDGQFHDLGAGYARGINDSGVVVGYSSENGGQAWYWDGERHYIGPGYANAISNAGHIAGYDNQQDQAFLWYEGARRLLPDTGFGGSYASAVNDFGVVAGTANGHPRPVGSDALVWQDGVPIDLGLAARNAMASDINNAGAVVGYLSRVGDGEVIVYESFLYNGQIIILPFDVASGINNLGVVIGMHRFERPVVWKDNELLELPEGGGANDINDNDVIVGWSMIDGDQHAVIWEPVPEPTSLLCLGAGLAWTAARRRAKHSPAGVRRPAFLMGECFAPTRTLRLRGILCFSQAPGCRIKSGMTCLWVERGCHVERSRDIPGDAPWAKARCRNRQRCAQDLSTLVEVTQGRAPGEAFAAGLGTPAGTMHRAPTGSTL